MSEFDSLTKIYDDEVAERAEKRKILKNLDMFVLDNSLRESTVAQLRGHTLEDKWAIFNEVKKCGFTNIIVASFSHMPRVGDAFVEQLSKQESDMSSYYAFSEMGDINKPEVIPSALLKMKKYRIRNVVFEIDLDLENGRNDSKHTERLCDLLGKRFDWVFDNLAADAKIFVNLRDLPYAIKRDPIRVFTVVKSMSTRPAARHPFGIAYESIGNFYPEEMAGWTKSIRKCMSDNGWKSGKLIIHEHEKWGFVHVNQLECLSTGADGVWASVCEIGAAVGHASSTVSIMNLVRLGNVKVMKKFNCTYLRQAAINVTKITSDAPPHPMQIIYGERAMDMVFDFGGPVYAEFDIAKFFGIEAPKRISTLASIDMVKERLVNLYGEDDQFNDEMASKMKQLMITDLTSNRKEEYMSYVGIAILFDRAGGKLTSAMRDAIDKVELKKDSHKKLIEAVRVIWDQWDAEEKEQDDNCLEFFSFYNGFMAPYFGCYQCDVAKKALQAIDMDADNKVDWSEFCVYLKWALNAFPDIETTDELLATAFQKGLIPAMQDETIKKEKARGHGHHGHGHHGHGHHGHGHHGHGHHGHGHK